MFKKNDIQALIFKKTRYLQKLKEQQAMRGLDTPASILLEIEDLEIELDNLQAQLIGLADAAGQEALTRINGQQLPLPETKPSAELFPRSPLLKNGERFLSRFTIEGFIGRGGFSDTYLAWDQAQDREVVVKRLPLAQQQQDFLKRFVAREVKIAQKLAPLNIPGLVKTYEVIQAEDEVCLVQESLPSRSLHHRIRDKGIIDIEEAMKTIVQVAQTLARLHQQGFVHGDIKPLNIMLRSPGNPVVIDLGAGRFFDEALEPQHVVFSALYSPQEWLTGQPVDGRVDVFALGMTLLHMLTGLPKFIYGLEDSMPHPVNHVGVGQRLSRASIREHIRVALTEIYYVGLRKVINQAVAEEPGDRFANMPAFFTALADQNAKIMTPY